MQFTFKLAADMRLDRLDRAHVEHGMFEPKRPIIDDLGLFLRRRLCSGRRLRLLLHCALPGNADKLFAFIPI
jgi:hypothetical protein